MEFQRRDIVLAVGAALVVGGLIPFMAPTIAIIIGIGIFFGIKLYVQKRKQQFTKAAGEGFCSECGQQVIDKKCPNCDKS